MKGANELLLGWMFATSWLLVIPLALPIGRLADVFGRAKLILLMTPIYCTSLLLLIFAWNTPSLIASGFLKGFYMLMAVTQAAMTAELVPKELLGSWLGMLGLFRGSVGVVSPILGGIIWENIGPEYVFYFLISTQVARILILFTFLSSDKNKSETVEK
jgi:MFS family permease